MTLVIRVGKTPNKVTQQYPEIPRLNTYLDNGYSDRGFSWYGPFVLTQCRIVSQ